MCLIFGIFKGYIVSVCIFSILNWFYPYKNWGISADRARSFNIIYKGSELLIEEFPSSEDFIDTKEKIKWEDGKEYPLYKLDISNKSHPYFTGQQNLVDTAGRIEKFNKKYNLQSTKSTDSKKDN